MKVCSAGHVISCMQPCTDIDRVKVVNCNWAPCTVAMVTAAYLAIVRTLWCDQQGVDIVLLCVFVCACTASRRSSLKSTFVSE